MIWWETSGTVPGIYRLSDVSYVLQLGNQPDIIDRTIRTDKRFGALVMWIMETLENLTFYLVRFRIPEFQVSENFLRRFSIGDKSTVSRAFEQSNFAIEVFFRHIDYYSRNWRMFQIDKLGSYTSHPRQIFHIHSFANEHQMDSN